MEISSRRHPSHSIYDAANWSENSKWPAKSDVNEIRDNETNLGTKAAHNPHANHWKMRWTKKKMLMSRSKRMGQIHHLRLHVGPHPWLVSQKTITTTSTITKEASQKDDYDLSSPIDALTCLVWSHNASSRSTNCIIPTFTCLFFSCFLSIFLSSTVWLW